MPLAGTNMASKRTMPILAEVSGNHLNIGMDK